jgi:hypothetical protein
MIDASNITKARETWILASKELGFRILTPYDLNCSGMKKEVFAFIPDYGGPMGMVINLISSPEFNTDSEIIDCAKIYGYYYSFINVEFCLTYNETYFKECLSDWGYHNHNGNNL